MFLKFYFLFSCGYVYVSADAWGGLKKVLDPIGLELQVGVSYPICVLGTNLGPLQEQYKLLHCAIPLVP